MSNPAHLPEIHRTIASVVIISADDKILMGRKDPHKGGVYPDAWHIPGGGVDKHEFLIDAAIREAKEEVGLELSADQLTPLPGVGHGEAPKTLKSGEQVWCHMTFNRFEVRLDQPAADIKTSPSDDLVELRWFARTELSLVEQIPGGREFFVEAGYIDASESKNVDVVAVGSCYIDINTTAFPFGEDGIPPEIELVGSDYDLVPGGSAVNFCRLLARLDIRTSFVGMAGSDPSGDLLEDLLHRSGVEPALIRRNDLSTNVSFNMTNPTENHILLVAGTANAALNADIALPPLTKVLPTAKVLYLGGCFKLKNLMPAFGDLIKLAARTKTQLVVDHGRVPTGTVPETLETIRQLVLNAAYHFPSSAEFLQLWGANNIEDGLQKVTKLAPALVTVVKDGRNGAFYLADGELKHVPAEHVAKVKDATGAGDSFNAGVMAAILHGHTLHQSVAYGCSVAAAKITGRTIPHLPS